MRSFSNTKAAIGGLTLTIVLSLAAVPSTTVAAEGLRFLVFGDAPYTGAQIEVLEKIRSLDNVIKGSIYEMKRYCGKSNCKCAKEKTPHKSMFLSFTYQGKTRLVPIKKDQIPQIREKISDYKELKAGIDELARIKGKAPAPLRLHELELVEVCPGRQRVDIGHLGLVGQLVPAKVVFTGP